MKQFLLAACVLLFIGISDAAAATLYRSVGITATDLKAAATVTISGTTATFSADQPNNVGVGDAVVYGSTYIAFITGRTSASVFTVQSSTGGTPTAAGAGTSVAVFRCFISLSNWNGNTTANTNINAAVRGSVLMASKDLVTAGHIMMVPCYADGADSASVTVDGWTTGASNYIKIYTPVATTEVGATQRHNGTWGNGYRRTAALTLSDEYVRVDGLSIYQTAADRIYFVSGSAGVGEVHISNCFGWYTNASATGFDVFDVWTVGTMTVKFWNCIGINDSTSASSEAFYPNDSSATVYIYNCTGIANAGRAFYTWQGTSHIKNSIGYSASSSAFLGSFSTVTYSASDDATADDWSGAGARINQTFSFVASGSQNYHLQLTDATAIDYGTNLSGDAIIPFATDIDGDPRPLGATWDIGADEAQPRGSLMAMEY